VRKIRFSEKSVGPPQNKTVCIPEEGNLKTYFTKYLLLNHTTTTTTTTTTNNNNNAFLQS
jgi:hypothetical protein